MYINIYIDLRLWQPKVANVASSVEDWILISMRIWTCRTRPGFCSSVCVMIMVGWLRDTVLLVAVCCCSCVVLTRS